MTNNYEELSIDTSLQSESSYIKAPTRTVFLFFLIKKFTTNDSASLDISIIEKLTYVGRAATEIDFNSISNSPDCEM